MYKPVKKIIAGLLALPVYIYRYTVSPFINPSCRHIPSCSQYMLDALEIHGPFNGFIIGLNRILRCGPGGTHGYDPVPLFRFRRYRPLSGLFGKYPKKNRLKR
jgi:putative membrane protein insertion efficiency factor